MITLIEQKTEKTLKESQGFHVFYITRATFPMKMG